MSIVIRTKVQKLIQGRCDHKEILNFSIGETIKWKPRLVTK